MFEVTFQGSKRIESVKVECFETARELAIQTGGMSKREWRILVVDIESGMTLDTGGQLTKYEASIVWRKWNGRKKKAVCIPWPEWAGEPTFSAKPAEVDI